MDRKRPYQYRALRLLFSVVCFMAMTSCTWVKDDTEDCPYGFWLRLHYTYNILDVEAVQKYIKDVSVYVYDAEGRYVRRIDVSQKMLKDNNHLVKVEGLAEGDYQFVLWSGLDSSEYAVSGDRQTLKDFQLSLAGSNHYSGELPPLYYGYLPIVHYDDSYAVHDVDMMKDTNQLACLVVSISEDTPIDPDDFTMSVISANGTLNARNQLLPGEEIVYEPFDGEYVTFDDPEYGELHGYRYSLTTLRLMSDTNCRLALKRKSTDQTLFNISLPEYVGAVGSLYTNLGRQVSVQEYLDRQDSYTIVFFFSEDLTRLLELRVNSWRLRANNHVKL